MKTTHIILMVAAIIMTITVKAANCSGSQCSESSACDMSSGNVYCAPDGSQSCVCQLTYPLGYCDCLGA